MHIETKAEQLTDKQIDHLAEKINAGIASDHSLARLSIADRSRVFTQAIILGRTEPPVSHRACVLLDRLLGIDVRHTAKQILMKYRSNLSVKDKFSTATVSIGDNEPEYLEMTSYYHLDRMFQFLNTKGAFTSVHLGAGFQRLGLYLGHFYPEATNYGFEIVEERVEVAQQSVRDFGFDNRIHCILKDLRDSDFILPKADIYFTFNSLEAPEGRKVIRNLKDLSNQHSFYLALHMGLNGFNNEDTTWLSKVKSIKPTVIVPEKKYKWACDEQLVIFKA